MVTAMPIRGQPGRPGAAILKQLADGQNAGTATISTLMA